MGCGVYRSTRDNPFQLPESLGGIYQGDALDLQSSRVKPGTTPSLEGGRPHTTSHNKLQIIWDSVYKETKQVFGGEIPQDFRLGVLDILPEGVSEVSIVSITKARNY